MKITAPKRYKNYSKFRKTAKKIWKLLPTSLRRRVPYRLKVRVREFLTPGHTNGNLEVQNLLNRNMQISDKITYSLQNLSNDPTEIFNLASLAVDLSPTPNAIEFILKTGEEIFGFDKGQLILNGVSDQLTQLGFVENSPSKRALKRSSLYLYSSIKHIPARKNIIHSGDKKLLYIINNSLPYSSNGYATRSHGVIQGFQSADINISVYTRAGYPMDMAATENPESVPPYDQVDSVLYNRLASPTFRTHFGTDYILEAAKSIEAIIGKERPSFVMAASNHRNALPALIAARNSGVPFIYEVRGFWEITQASRQPDFDKSVNFKVQVALESKTAQEADLVITLNSGMKQELINRGVSADKIHLLPNSVEQNHFSPMERDAALADELNIPDHVPVIGYIGTFVDYEGLDDLTRACALLKKDGIEFRLLLVGNDNPSSLSLSGSVTDLVRQCADEGGISDWLIMPGRVPFDMVAKYYSLVDIAPFPRKPWQVCELVSPLKPLESMMMGKAVIVSSVAALADMVDNNETGIIFDKGSVQSLAVALKQMIESPDLRSKLGSNARRWVTDFRTWNYSVRQVIPAIRQLSLPIANENVVKISESLASEV